MNLRKVDLHMHSTASDGTDTPAELLAKVKQAGMEAFAVTDHDAVKACAEIRPLLREGDPAFINGVELSCRDEYGKYHILGYAYDLEKKPLADLVERTHNNRLQRVRARLQFIAENYGFTFSEEDLKALFSLNNPGKPHIGNMMVRYGYAPSKEIAITEFINKAKTPKSLAIRPETAIEAILGSGGIPVLAHGIYGDGSQFLMPDELEERIVRLKEFGLKGLEGYYSGYSPRIEKQMLGLADRYDLLVSAGSDYHGTNKIIELGDTNLEKAEKISPRLEQFLDVCLGQ